MKNHEGNVELQKKVHRIYIYSYIFNQNIYRAKWFTFMESEIIGNVELFALKKFLFSTLSCIGGMLFVNITSERSKYKNNQQFNTDC